MSENLFNTSYLFWFGWVFYEEKLNMYSTEVPKQQDKYVLMLIQRHCMALSAYCLFNSTLLKTQIIFFTMHHCNGVELLLCHSAVVMHYRFRSGFGFGRGSCLPLRLCAFAVVFLCVGLAARCFRGG